MKNYQKKYIILFLFGFYVNIYTSEAQTSQEKTIYNWYDNSVGKENLDINNGVPHINPYKTIDSNTNMYLVEDEFSKGSVVYDGQIYHNTNLKYDIYRDEIILNPEGASEVIGINLTKRKVTSFSIYNKNFIKIEKEQYTLPEFSTGYYEINEYKDNLFLYIKHQKNIQKKIKEDGIFYQYKEHNSYYIDYQKKLYPISNKSDVIKIFPEQKKQINEFYVMNKVIKKADFDQFTKNLMTYISNSLSNQTK
ncbi:hypothetical protein GON26_15485 [Flavobacterium sp. GA093]|uniref:Uncharacterized protein n=1 Tax=Flavobacterium hydrocarbonoxydans TaxID=2683249 RepID=A0A6I4NNA1_9FLAO|nr:hypothetical protein [Flavobacterium hydrocarbonoxydans]MWB95770.1 hypothetical protein [Flavobacterium hydrocarbonoxydans]